MDDFGKELKSKLDLIGRALVVAGIPGGAAFYVLDQSGANTIVSYLLTINLVAVLLLFIIAHSIIKTLANKDSEVNDGSRRDD